MTEAVRACCCVLDQLIVPSRDSSAQDVRECLIGFWCERSDYPGGAITKDRRVLRLERSDEISSCGRGVVRDASRSKLSLNEIAASHQVQPVVKKSPPNKELTLLNGAARMKTLRTVDLTTVNQQIVEVHKALRIECTASCVGKDE